MPSDPDPLPLCIVVAPSNSVHSFRWCRQLEMAGCKVRLVSPIPGESGNEFGRSFLAWPFIPTAGMAGAVLKAINGLNMLSTAILALTLLAQRPAWINVHYLTGQTFRLAYWLSRICPGRLMVTCWGTDVNSYFLEARGRARQKYLWLYAHARLLTCDSEAIRQTIQASAPEARVELVTWGVDGKHFRLARAEERSAARDRFGLPREGLVFLSNRLPQANYRLGDIVNWFIQLSGEMPGARLLLHAVGIYSDGSCDGALAQARAHPAIIVSEGMLAYEDLSGLYAAADVFLSFPHRDATPVSMLEAIASGLDVAASGGIEAYKMLSEKYQLHLLSLQDLTRPRIEALGIGQHLAAGENRATFEKEHSIEACSGKLRQVMGLGEVP